MSLAARGTTYADAGRAAPSAHYVLPLRWADDAELDDLTAYLAVLAREVPVTVVDGSPPALFACHEAAWAGLVEHVAPEPWFGANGKVGGVMTGLRRAGAEVVVLADDDVRWTANQLRRAVLLLGDADVLRPQNAFAPLPWHARWDTARTLVNRAFSADYPGTLVVRRSSVLAAGGYAGDVMFENLELIRTLVARGGREVRADDLVVLRRPPSARQFCRQRVRQAYDDLAQPRRLALEAALLPVAVGAVAARRPTVLAGLAAASVALAWRGRSRAGREHFPVAAVLVAPLWVLERAVCVWVALGARARGGVVYRGRRVPRAASSVRRLRARALL
jgi:hypothetical protein